MASDLALRRTDRSTVLLRTLALVAALAAALAALLGSGPRPAVLPIERSSFQGGAGYWLLGKDGGVFAFGDAGYFGANRNQGNDIAGMAATATGKGYWTIDDDGDVFAYGDAKDYGSRPGPDVDDIVGFAARSQGDGYWMVAKDGSVYAFGSAGFHGSASKLRLTRPIVGITATPSGKGYWLIAGDGGVFAYGDARFFGSTGNIRLSKPIVDFGPTPSGAGYRFIGSDGGVFAYGDAGFFGSTGGMRLNLPIVAFAATATGNGYWLVGQDGGVFAFGDAKFYGSTGSIKLNAPIVAIVATPRVNILPTARDDTATVAEDSAVTIDVEANDTHALPAAVSVASNPAHGTAAVSGTNVVYTPSSNYNGSDSFTYKLTDTVGHSGTATVTVTVTSVNDAPTISNIADRTTPRNTPTGAVAFTVGDVETAAGSLTVSGSSSNQTVVPNANVVFGGSGASRTVTVTPATNTSGSATITVTVTDANSGTASDSFVLTVNAAPTISDIADGSTNEDTATGALAFTVGDVETAAGSLTVSGSSSNTTLVPNANIVFGGSGANRTTTITPAANQNGTATITVTVTDAGGATGSDSFVLTVTSVNDLPTISDIADQSTNEDTATSALAFTVGDIETTAGSLTVSGSSSNTILVPNGNIVFGGSGANRTVTATPAADQSGTATITVTVTDANSGTASDSFVLTVNAAPTISDIADGSTNEDTATGALAFTVGDVETAAGSLTVSGSSSNTTLVPNANIVFGGSGANRTTTITPAANQNGTATITVTVTDAGGATGSDSFVLTVTSVNDLPTISDIADQSTNEDTATSALPFTVGDIETTAGSLTVSGSSSNTILVPNGNIVFGGSGANRTVTATPAADQSGTATITVTVTDANSGTASDSFVLTVNAAPTISDIADGSTNEDTATGALAFTVGDVETAAGSLTVSGSSSNTTLVPNANIVFGGSGANRTTTITPAANQNGTATITVTVTDAGGATGSDSFVLTVTSVNDLPTISDIADQSTNEDTATGALPFTVGDVETVAGSLTLSGSSNNTTLVPNANIVFGGSGASRTVTVTPAANQNGTATITVTVTDANSGPANDMFVLTVNAVNDPPTISDVVDLSTNEDTATAALAFTVDDPETAATSLSVSGSSNNTTLVPNANIVLAGSGANRTVTVTPALDQSGTATITVTVDDGNGGTASDTFVLTVIADEQPVAVDDSVSIPGLLTSDINVLGNDSGLDNEPVTVTVEAATLNSLLEGTATVGLDGTIHFTPALGGLLNFTFDYTVTDADGDSDTGTVTVSIL